MKILRFNESLVSDGMKNSLIENFVRYEIVYTREGSKRFYVSTSSANLDLMVEEYLKQKSDNDMKFYLIKMNHKEELVSDKEIELIANANKYNL